MNSLLIFARGGIYIALTFVLLALSSFNTYAKIPGNAGAGFLTFDIEPTPIGTPEQQKEASDKVETSSITQATPATQAEEKEDIPGNPTSGFFSGVIDSPTDIFKDPPVSEGGEITKERDPLRPRPVFTRSVSVNHNGLSFEIKVGSEREAAAVQEALANLPEDINTQAGVLEYLKDNGALATDDGFNAPILDIPSTSFTEEVSVDVYGVDAGNTFLITASFNGSVDYVTDVTETGVDNGTTSLQLTTNGKWLVSATQTDALGVESASSSPLVVDVQALPAISPNRSPEETDSLNTLRNNLRDSSKRGGVNVEKLIKSFALGAGLCFITNLGASALSFTVPTSGSLTEECIFKPVEDSLKEAIIDIVIGDIYDYISTGGLYGKSIFQSTPRRFAESVGDKYVDLILQGPTAGSQLLGRLCSPFQFRDDLAVGLGGGFDLGDDRPFCSVDKIKKNIELVKAQLLRKTKQNAARIYLADKTSLSYSDSLGLFTDASIDSTRVYSFLQSALADEKNEAIEELEEDSVDGTTAVYADGCKKIFEDEPRSKNEKSIEASGGNYAEYRAEKLSDCEQIVSAATARESHLQTRRDKVNEILNADDPSKLFTILIEAATKGLLTRLFVEDPTDYSSLPADYGGISRSNLSRLARDTIADPPVVPTGDFALAIAASTGRAKKLLQKAQVVYTAVERHVENFDALRELAKDELKYNRIVNAEALTVPSAVFQNSTRNTDIIGDICTPLTAVQATPPPTSRLFNVGKFGTIYDETNSTTIFVECGNHRDGPKTCERRVPNITGPVITETSTTINTYKPICSITNNSQFQKAVASGFLDQSYPLDRFLNWYYGDYISAFRFEEIKEQRRVLVSQLTTILSSITDTSSALNIYIKDPSVYGVRDTNKERKRIGDDLIIKKLIIPSYVNVNIGTPDELNCGAANSKYPSLVERYQQTGCTVGELTDRLDILLKQYADGAPGEEGTTLADYTFLNIANLAKIDRAMRRDIIIAWDSLLTAAPKEDLETTQ